MPARGHRCCLPPSGGGRASSCRPVPTSRLSSRIGAAGPCPRSVQIIGIGEYDRVDLAISRACDCRNGGLDVALTNERDECDHGAGVSRSRKIRCGYPVGGFEFGPGRISRCSQPCTKLSKRCLSEIHAGIVGRAPGIRLPQLDSRYTIRPSERRAVTASSLPSRNTHRACCRVPSWKPRALAERRRPARSSLSLTDMDWAAAPPTPPQRARIGIAAVQIGAFLNQSGD